MNKKEEINVLISINKKFLYNSEELIFSVLCYSSEIVHIFLMYQENELCETDIEHIKNFVEKTGKGYISFIKINASILKGAPVTDNEGFFFGVEAYSRLFCAFKLPENVKKILYLDVDMVCTGDIKELYDISVSNKSWVAVKDEGIKKEDLERLDLPNDHNYINSGMLLINIEKLRKNFSEESIASLIMKNKDVLVYPDQDFINKCFSEDIKIIDKKYNLLAKSVRYNDLKSKPLIIHYAGYAKPWNDNVSRFDKEFLIPYYEILKLQGNDKKDKLEELLNKHKIYGYSNFSGNEGEVNE